MIVDKLKVKSEENKIDGITLISLVITIILLIILAGVVINLSLGENGVFRRAQEAKLKEAQSSAREKLELTLLDLQTLKYTDENYDEKEYINNYLENRQMYIDEDIVTVDNWKFQIDRTVPKIIENLEQIEAKARVLISVPYVGTRSATIKVQNVTNVEEVQEYTYMLNEEEIVSTSEEKYEMQDCLEPKTTYKIKVIAKYKDDLTIESNEVTIKTEDRTYLFNNGDTCDEITGGWSAIAGPEDPEYPDVTMVAPTLTFDEDEKCMDVSLEAISNGFNAGILKVNKKIDYKQYRKICVEAVAALSRYNNSSCISIGTSNKEGYYNDDGTSICYEHIVSEKTTFELNIYELEEVEDIYIFVQCHSGDGPVGVGIYNVWLEK